MLKAEVAGFWPSLGSYSVTAATLLLVRNHRANHGLREMSCISQMEEWQKFVAIFNLPHTFCLSLYL